MDLDLKDAIRSIQDYPKKGILFRDISLVLQKPEYLQLAFKEFQAKLAGVDFDLIAGPESRGFLFAVPLAYMTHKGFIYIRKAGKLPCATVQKTYDLEYGTATIEMHKDSVMPGQKVIIVDDLLATGGTCKAAAELIEEMGGTVAAMLFLIELEELKGRETLKEYYVQSILKY